MNEISISVKKNGIAIAALDDPDRSMNTLTPSLLECFKKKLKPLFDDDAIKAIILISAKPKVFIAGADIKLFSTIEDPNVIREIDAEYSEFFTFMASHRKPVIAAVNGAALGGGLETVLACDYILATDHPSTTFGLPEVKLGILPAAGGTYRLPQRVGILKGLDMMLTGKFITSQKAKKLGLVDEIVSHSLLSSRAMEIAQCLIINPSNRQPKRRKPLWEYLVATWPFSWVFFNLVRRKVLNRTKGNYPGPEKIIECVKQGITRGQAAALKLEIEYISQLFQTPECQSLVWLFISMKEMAPVPENNINIKNIDLWGISSKRDEWASLLRKHYHICEYDPPLNGSGEPTNHILPSGDCKEKPKADIIIDVSPSHFEKRGFYINPLEERIDNETPILFSSLSTTIKFLGEKASHADRVLGLNIFQPIRNNPIFEMVIPDKSSEKALSVVRSFIAQTKKPVIEVKDQPGFYIPRLLYSYFYEALILSEICPFHKIDAALESFGFAMGPFALMDHMGLDTIAQMFLDLSSIFEHQWRKKKDFPLKIVDEGYLGSQSNAGFYKYKQGKRLGPNETLATHLNKKSENLYDHTEKISESLVFAIVNEALLCYEKKIISSPKDGDLGAVFGLAFPPFMAGPFHYFDRMGKTPMIRRIEKGIQEKRIHFKLAHTFSDYHQDKTFFSFKAGS